MGFEIELAMARLEHLNANERQAVFTAARFLVSASKSDEAYAFAALNVRNIKLQVEELAMVEGELGGFSRKPVVTVFFQCDVENFLGTKMYNVKERPPAPVKPLTPEEEEKELENILASLTVKRVERGDIISG